MYTPSSFQSQIPKHLWQQLAQQKQILKAVRSLLPEALAKQVCHALISEDKLLIYTDSAVWATQLRFYQPTLLSAFKNIVNTVQIRITDTGLEQPVERRANVPSMDTIKALEKDSLTIEDETLRQSLLNLSETLARLSKT